MKAWFGLGKPSKGPELLSAERQIPQQALHALQDAFSRVARGSDSLSKAEFLELIGIADPKLQALSDGLLAAVRTSSVRPTTKDTAASITLEDLTIAKWHCLHDGDEAGATFAFRMLRPDSEDRVSWDSLSAATAACMQLATGHEPPEESVAGVVQGAQRVADEEGELGKHLTRRGFLTWAKRFPAVAATMRSLLAFGTTAQDSGSSAAASASSTGGGSAATGTSATGSQDAAGGKASGSSQLRVQLPPVPQLISLQGFGAASCLLRPEWAWAIAASGLLSAQRCQEWRLLFSSVKHGQSFSTFMGRCSDKGATLVLVKDKGGAIFGGFAATPWERHGDFYGSFENFLFSLQPATMIYKASGVNQNFQFSGQNFTQVPNGLGFGGQINYWGLYVDGQCDGGMSRDCSTFKSPTLSSEPVFQVDTLECWQVDLPEPEDEGAPKRRGGANGGSVLSQRGEDKQLLELAGRRMQHAER